MKTDIESALGPYLRHLREARDLALWQVAAAAEMDSTLLSKIERGHRFPTPEQAALLARFFNVPIGEMEGRRIMSKFWRDHGNNPAVAEAVQKIQETAPAYIVSKSVNKRGRTTG
jgi:transcriptional regulator with XRE-family HTH domain